MFIETEIEFNKGVHELFKKIGFELTDVEVTKDNVRHYKYRPGYLVDTHYTLVVYKGHDYRLYTHYDEDGSFETTPFQISAYNEYCKNLLMEKINEVFPEEIKNIERNNKIR